MKLKKPNQKGCFCVLLVLSIICIANKKAYSQDTLTSANIETKTYQLFLDKNWSELIETGNEAIKKDYDYFYLRMRVGIAYFEKQNYSLAEKHFRKALDFNSYNDLAQEYLYYCYVYTGKTEEASKVSISFSKALHSKIGTDKAPPMEFITFEAATKLSDSLSYYSPANNTYDNYFNPATYLQFGIKHSIKNRISFFHAATWYGQESFEGTSKQLQYFLQGSIPLPKRWLIAPSIHLVNTKFTSEIVPEQTSTGIQPPTQKVTSIGTYFVGSLAIRKTIHKFDYGIGTTFSNTSEIKQFNHFGNISYAVLGNSKLVIGIIGYLNTIDSYSSFGGSISSFIYLQPSNYMSVKFSYLNNQGNNIIEDNGYLVNNSMDLTTSRYGIQANFGINKAISMYMLYQLEFKEQSTQLFSYHYNVFLAGIKINPRLFNK